MSKATEASAVKVIVLAVNNDGQRDFHSCAPMVTPAERKDGLHYTRAIENAEYNGYQWPMIAFDETDPAFEQMASLANWIRPQKTSVLIVPSSEGREGDLLFVVPAGGEAEATAALAAQAIRQANDENGERSDEVIAVMEKAGYAFLGNPGTDHCPLSPPWDALPSPARKRSRSNAPGM